ncbi:DUF1788 domain-containing protein [Methylocaldum sp. RMAD-M]|uniref:DUF1788 domain-containing protein n=1 Tax=Methylocaldum sp. RMAD-M TaxID=2806557 RepID=UPI001AEA46D6|nr:DUF1788 domain-containing protein [Methylocaldum sp. RMAD-M]MBP1152765.1 hypothetical protein [Methylocaldum sp. RMAD-M]
MVETFEERLNRILPRLTSTELLNNKGLGNEIGFYIFDYPPEREMEMRAFLRDVIEPRLAKHQPPIRAVTINLFELAIGVLEERKLLDKAIAMQRDKGDDAVLASLRSVLKEDKLAQRLITTIDLDNTDLVLLSGVGAVYPMLRTHTLLSALHPLMKDKPLVMFYPGRYDGMSLRLFNRLGDDHYYRAFRLVA